MTSVNDTIQLLPAEACTPDLAVTPWTFDSMPGYGPGAS